MSPGKVYHVSLTGLKRRIRKACLSTALQGLVPYHTVHHTGVGFILPGAA